MADEQRRKFEEAAREHSCDEDEAAFDEKLRKLEGTAAPYVTERPKEPKDGK